MSRQCNTIHYWLNSLKVLKFPFDEGDIPLNGIYILFEKGELAHGTNRIVRVGTHTGNNQLPSRLKQHFIAENKDRSIFRKNVGRCILNKTKDAFLEMWELDLTSREAKDRYSNLVDIEKQKQIEKQVTRYIKNNFSFVAFPVDNKSKRLELESRMISTVSLCDECGPSRNWLGLFSPRKRIRQSGLWLVNKLYKEPLSDEDMTELKNALKEFSAKS